MKRGYFVSINNGIILLKTRFYCYGCYIHKRVYYCHGIVGKYSDTRTLFIEHQHCVVLFSVGWCVCLLSTFLHMLNSFLKLFSSCCIYLTLLQHFFLFFLKLWLYNIFILYFIVIISALPYRSDANYNIYAREIFF